MFQKRTLISHRDRRSNRRSNTMKKAVAVGRSSSSELPPSVLAVLSIDDILIEILLRLPVISLLLFKSVSKRWFSLITDANFIVRRSKFPNLLDPPSGIFVSRSFNKNSEKLLAAYDFVPLDIRIPAYRYPRNNNALNNIGYSGDINFLYSCNGLILLCMDNNLREVYVYNPSVNVNMLKKLPEPPHGLIDTDECSPFGYVIAFDGTRSPHYKVLNPRVLYANGSESVKILVYSLETSNWYVCDGQFPLDSFTSGFNHGIYLNDCIHWVHNTNPSGLVFKLHVEHLVLTTIPTPRPLKGKWDYDNKVFESRGCLLFSSIVCTGGSPPSQHLKIYEMSSSGWLLKCSVNLDGIGRRVLKTLKFRYSVQCIVLGGERHEDSFVVIKINSLVLQYKFLSKTLSILHDIGSKTDIHNTLGYQFIASFAGV